MEHIGASEMFDFKGSKSLLKFNRGQVFLNYIAPNNKGSCIVTINTLRDAKKICKPDKGQHKGFGAHSLQQFYMNCSDAQIGKH